jgi:hypothetical protein
MGCISEQSQRILPAGADGKHGSELHSDSIEIEGDASKNKVAFSPFIGISPFRYRELFEKGRRKYSGGIAQQWNRDERRPMIEVYYPSYFKAEAHVVQLIESQLNELNKKKTER